MDAYVPTLDDETLRRLEEHSDATGQSRDEVLKAAVADYLSEARVRERFDRHAAASLEDYERTGLHLTHEEVLDWFAKLKSGTYVAPPECHE